MRCAVEMGSFVIRSVPNLNDIGFQAVLRFNFSKLISLKVGIIDRREL
jgi:hypothetical protein